MANIGRWFQVAGAGSAVLALALGAAPARAAVTIGQTAPSAEFCQSTVDRLQPSVTSGNSYVVPATVAAGTITSWSTQAMAGAGRRLAMKVYRPLGGGTYLVIGHDGPHTLNPSALNIFATSVPVRAGDVLGSSTPSAAGFPGCSFGAPGDSYLQRSGNLADGESASFPNATPDVRLNVSAAVSPSNAFDFLRARRNQRKGIAVLPVRVPNAGLLVLRGKGLKKSSAATATISRTVAAPGVFKLRVRAKGSKRQALERNGTVKVRAKITYTPSGGDSRTRTRKLKLKKRV